MDDMLRFPSNLQRSEAALKTWGPCRLEQLRKATWNSVRNHPGIASRLSGIPHSDFTPGLSCARSPGLARDPVQSSGIKLMCEVPFDPLFPVAAATACRDHPEMVQDGQNLP
jgi:hypothetical protein